MKEGQMTDDRYRVVLLNGGGQAEGWLTARLRITNVAWDAGDFTYDDAKVFARWASFHIRRGLELCTWTVVPVSPEAHRRRTADHYSALADEAAAS
jgi:hypothetical protein